MSSCEALASDELDDGTGFVEARERDEADGEGAWRIRRRVGECR